MKRKCLVFVVLLLAMSVFPLTAYAEEPYEGVINAHECGGSSCGDIHTGTILPSTLQLQTEDGVLGTFCCSPTGMRLAVRGQGFFHVYTAPPSTCFKHSYWVQRYCMTCGAVWPMEYTGDYPGCGRTP